LIEALAVLEIEPEDVYPSVRRCAHVSAQGDGAGGGEAGNKARVLGWKKELREQKAKGGA
jgi:hypothetical protein